MQETTVASHQIDLVRDSFVQVLFAVDHAAAVFYGKLFELAPETRPMFTDDLDQQGRRLIAALAKIVTGLSNLDVILPSLEALARRHVEYGAEERHYAIVGASLLHMVETIAGPEFDAATATAWRDAYALISGMMIAASRGAAPFPAPVPVPVPVPATTVITMHQRRSAHPCRSPHPLSASGISARSRN